MKKIIFLYLFIPSIIFSQTAKDVARKGISSTVSVVALDNYRQPLNYGSGFILSNNLIATNVHVIEGSNSAYIILNGSENKIKVLGLVGIDNTNDLAILKTEKFEGMPLELGNEILPEIGERIYAIGNPKGLNGTFSEGIISGIRDNETNDILQITAPISPGSSGGPVLDRNGKVIGVAFASYSAGQNLNFAIPVKYLSEILSNQTEIQSLKAIKPKQKITSKKVTPNIKEGVIIRNIKLCHGCAPKTVFFSIKNDLPYTISDITVLLIVYDASGTIVDYNESTYYKKRRYSSSESGIKPFLAKTIDFYSDERSPTVALEKGYSVKARVLDFKIIDE